MKKYYVSNYAIYCDEVLYIEEFSQDSIVIWENFNTGNIYYDNNCNEYYVIINHNSSEVMLVKLEKSFVGLFDNE